MTSIVAGRRELRRVQRLKKILLVCAVATNSCHRLFSTVRTRTDVPRHRENPKSPRLTAFAFTSLPTHHRDLFWDARKRTWRKHRNRSTLHAGRERRISSSPSPVPSNHKEKQDLLVEQEEDARRKRLDQMDRRIQQLARRDERITILEAKLNSETSNESLTDAEKAELEGLRRVQDNFEEQYDPQDFSEEHVVFKALHNQVFCNLVRWCEQSSVHPHSDTKIFFLDGPDGGTTSHLIQKGNFHAHQCYVANRHESTCTALVDSSGGLLPIENVVHATCTEALTKGGGSFSELDFTGYYFDGCGGYAPHIINMMTSALLVLEGDDGILNTDRKKKARNEPGCKRPIVVGYSLLGGTKNLVEKELEISRAMTIIAHSRGMRMVHALDDPLRFDLPTNVPKLGGKSGTTFTTWLVLEP